MVMRIFFSLLLAAGALTAQPPSDGKLRIIAFGAHPDDCDSRAGGTAAKYAALGHHVKFVSITNGDAGHQSEGGGALAMRRRKEAQEAGRRIGIRYETLDNHDGELVPSLAVRQQVIRKIREWNADIVLAPRPNDYHPDHRYAGVLVQDAAYMVVVPNVAPDTPPLRKNPVFFYFQDRFQRPNPFRPDVAVAIDDVVEKKLAMLDAHTSQMYEWLPWVAGNLDSVPRDGAARLEWLRKTRFGRPVSDEVRATLRKRYGGQSESVRHAEAFELCEYGRQPSESDLRALFPFFPAPGQRGSADRGNGEGSEAGFVPLFDGKSLEGWTLVGGKGRGYVVEDGNLVCPADGGGNLFTRSQHANFVFRFEFRLEPDSNNGIGIRAPLTTGVSRDGMEIQIIDVAGPRYRTGRLRPEQYHGAVYDMIPARHGFLRKTGEWNQQEITADGRRIRVRLNNVTILDASLDMIQEPEVLKKHPGIQRASGHLGLLGHGTRVEFRNLRVKDLP
jgi:LmbE family N-acetylglucosaminyl deacetylase